MGLWPPDVRLVVAICMEHMWWTCTGWEGLNEKGVGLIWTSN